MKQNGVRPAIISSIGMPIVPRITMTLWMKPTGNRSPSATKNQRRHRYVLHVRIIMKNSAIMKTAVIAAAICDARFACRDEFEKHEQRPENNRQGQQNGPADAPGAAARA